MCRISKDSSKNWPKNRQEPRNCHGGRRKLVVQNGHLRNRSLLCRIASQNSPTSDKHRQQLGSKCFDPGLGQGENPCSPPPRSARPLPRCALPGALRDAKTKQTPCFEAHAPRKTYEAPCFKQTNGLEPADRAAAAEGPSHNKGAKRQSHGGGARLAPSRAQRDVNPFPLAREREKNFF